MPELEEELPIGQPDIIPAGGHLVEALDDDGWLADGTIVHLSSWLDSIKFR